ncbi:unnamed protein product [Cylicocyclus nassatus]|uniref:Amino acid transporter transmembrane domain-containing protein n=1 Tax=Cylicocyclus nassatus TaxID=53992 RepID=A0AA36GRC4_CYLNA|nr:unnamed protein product [Cylicocyclus nassatus]
MGQKQKKNSSIVTIFTLWNTLMGVSLMSMPWALHQAGLFLGLFLFVAMELLCCYTAYLILQSPKGLEKVDPTSVEFQEICRAYFGKTGEILALVFSLFILCGSIFTYFVLMSNFLFFSGELIYGLAHPSGHAPVLEEPARCDFHCQLDNQMDPSSFNSTEPVIVFGLTFHQLWQLRLTVPIIIAIVTFSLLNFKSPTFFTKFGVLGTISIIYIVVFTTARLFKCGIHVSLTDPTSEAYVQSISWRFPALTGTLTVSFFLHMGILAIFRHQKYPENNTRDLSLGFALAGISYIIVAVTFYLSFPFAKSCIHDNLLNNFSADYIYGAIARVLLLFQLITITPIMTFFIRTQLSCFIFKTSYPGLRYVLILNIIVATCGALVAIFYPNVGTIVRYVGAVTGVVYTYALPCLVYMKEQHLQNKLTPLKLIAHSSIIVFGVANFLAQFFL